MIYEREIVTILEALHPVPWQGLIYRHMFADNPPTLQNKRGARWNPPQVPAVYAALERDTVLAEAAHQMSLQPLRPKAKRTVYTLRVRLYSVLDVTEPEVLEKLGIDKAALGSIDWSRCQQIGGATAWLGNDGMLIPSARAGGTNLVIFPSNADDIEFEIVDTEEIAD